MVTRGFVCVGVAALCCVTMFGQAFEMADVHVSPHSDNPSLSVLHRDGKYELLGASMVDLVSTAYGVKADAVTGGPGWLESDRFDVIAKAPNDLTGEPLKAALQALLADRFGLVVHHDTKPMPAWVLSAGKIPRVKQSDGVGDGRCEDDPTAHSPTINGVLSCHNITMAAFAQALQTDTTLPASSYISRNAVVDLTGLKGTWDFTVKWAGRGLVAKVGSDGISLFDAVDKQLGLNLAMGKAPLPVLVVDSVNQKPTANLPGVTEKLPELRLEFDVADIKPSTQDHPTAPKFTPGGRMEVKGVTLIALIQHAWGLDTFDDELISGGPKWLTSERFDIVAKAMPPDGPSSAIKDDDALRAMLRNMLTDRFGLVVQSEEKQVTVYALTADKPKLKQADPSGRSKCSEGPAVTAALAGVLPQRTITCANSTTAQLAERLHGLAPGYINRPVVDATGIDGAWDFSLLYSRPVVVNGVPPADGQPGAADPTGALTLFEALQKELGLRLATEKRAMPVLVIDHVEQKPTDN
jgi:uncharacterized protein (TIGR03435 family)